MTPAEIIQRALKKAGVLGVGQSALAEDTNDAFVEMNQMISQWNRKRWLLYHLLDLAKVCTGAESYTVGPGGDFDTPRADKLETAYLRQIVPSQPSPVDYPLTLLQSREDYSRIPLKQLGSFPQYVFMDTGFPLGSVYAWPIPNANIYEMHIVVKAQIDQFASLTQTIELPPEYLAALEWNLACRLRPMYQLEPDASAVALAKDALNLIRNANAQIPRLVTPARIRRPGAKYNIFGDYSY